MMEFVSWDDDIPNTWKIIKFMFQTTNQLCMMFYLITPTWDDLQQSVDKWISGYVDKWDWIRGSPAELENCIATLA